MTLVYDPRKFDIFIGIDAHKTSFYFAIFDKNDIVCSKKIPSDPENLMNYLRKNFPKQKAICAYEAGPTGFSLHDALTSNRIPCLVVPPTSIAQKPNEKTKNDRLDATKLAKMLKNGELHSVHVPVGPYRQLRSIIKSYELYSHSRVDTKRRIKSLLLSAGLPVPDDTVKPNWTNPYLQYLKTVPCQPYIRERLDLLLKDMTYARQQILATIQQINQCLDGHPLLSRQVQHLRSIRGIGLITAACLLGRMGDPKELQNCRKLGAFTGIVPSEHSSGQKISQGSITRIGDPFLRSLLVEASWKAIKNNVPLRKFFDRIAAKHHRNFAKRKAIVAVARKLTLYIYAVLKQDRPFMAY